MQSEVQIAWGDVIHVNGEPWPFLNVEPRKYRFRFLNAAISRSFALYFATAADLNGKLPFQVIASDSGLLERPVQVSDMFVSMAERYEIVFDFSAYAGQAIELRNLDKVGGIGTDTDYANTDEVMRFIVGSGPVEDLWELENRSGGWSHPIHVHLVDFKVLARYGDEANRGVLPYEAAGLKDVVWLGSHETVLVEAHYQPWGGVYMLHCHNLIHEDHDPMAAFNVTALDGLGYDEATDFSDPMDARWRAQPYSHEDLAVRAGIFDDGAIVTKVQDMARQQPYSELDQVEGALNNYWASNGAGNANSPVKRRGDESLAVGPIPRYRRFQI